MTNEAIETMDANFVSHQRNSEAELFKKEPRLNVISKEAMEERIQKVFFLLWQTLSKSFGPYGAPTMIMNYPYQHVTKDGFTIMKNLSMDASEQFVDQSIANMASDICGRLNYAVGDGTTTAVVATNSIFQNYLAKKHEFESKMILPRDILNMLGEIKDVVIEQLKQLAVPIQSKDPDELYANIYKVVYISSNGDATIADFIATLYKEIGFPGVSCELSTDGTTRTRLIKGYKYNLSVNDKLYINSDNNTMQISNADVIMLGVKVTKSVYENILKPLNEQCRVRKRKLIVCANAYDETTLTQIIRRDLMSEYGKSKDINMVLCTYKAISDHTRKMAHDFAMLCNTILIDRELKAMIDAELANGKTILEVFNIDDRDDIPNLVKLKKRKSDGQYVQVNFDDPENEKDLEPIFDHTNAIRLGYVGSGEIGLKDSVFSDFFYDEGQYAASIKDAQGDVEEAVEKYSKMGSFNVVVNQANERLFSLRLKMGVVEVGGTSELSQKMLRDAVDDAVKAAASAFNHGIVLGCNVSLISVLNLILNNAMHTENINPGVITLLTILREGYMDTYRTVLMNAFHDIPVVHDMEADVDQYHDLISGRIIEYFGHDIFTDEAYKKYIVPLVNNCRIRDNCNGVCYLHDLIIVYSAISGQVFDVTTKEFTKDIINSSQTDEEVLTATIDLIGLLITGNQMVVTQKHNF